MASMLCPRNTVTAGSMSPCWFCLAISSAFGNVSSLVELAILFPICFFHVDPREEIWTQDESEHATLAISTPLPFYENVSNPIHEVRAVDGSSPSKKTIPEYNLK